MVEYAFVFYVVFRFGEMCSELDLGIELVPTEN